MRNRPCAIDFHLGFGDHLRVKAKAVILGFLLSCAAAQAAPVTFDDLTLKDGRVLHHVTIVSFGTTTAMAKWDGGMGTIRIDNLPDGIAPAPRPAPAPPPPAAPAAPAAAPGAPPPDVDSGAPGPPRNFQTQWQTETEYILETIASDLTEMAYYAKHQKARPGNGLAATIEETQVPGFPGQLNYLVKADLGEDGEVGLVLPMSGAIWAPETYKPLADALIGKLGLKGTPEGETDAPDIVHLLLEPTVEHLVSEDQRVSTSLTESFTSAAAHERAAFLLAVFGSREEPGIFYQAKFGLCRTTAHLAFAAALAGGKPPSEAGQIAKALHTALYNNEAEALVLAKALPSDPDSMAWQRVIRMRATGDYRIFKETDSPTLAERFERLRSFSVLGADGAWAEARISREDAPDADWWRVIGSQGASVQLGHTLFEGRIGVELREAKIAYDSETGTNFPASGFTVLNAEPAHCVTAGADGAAVVRVIGWGTWAAFEQRGLCAAISEDFDFLQRKWGVPADASTFQKEVDDKFWELRLYPFVRRQDATEQAYYHSAQDDEMALVHGRPQDIPATAWNDIGFTPANLEHYVPGPHPFINEWHRPNPPPGTAYDIEPRMNQPSLIDLPNFTEELERLHALAPYDELISFRLLHRKHSFELKLEEVQRVYGPTVDYSPSPCIWLAKLSADMPGGYEKWMNQAIAMVPGFRHELGNFYAARGRDAEAEATFDAWNASETDEVTLSNSLEWLVEYKERKGDSTGATEVATKMYNTGSGRGMKTMAHLIERRKFYDQAYKICSEVRERYNDSTAMIGFLYRMKKEGNPARKDSLLDSLLQAKLPHGLLPAPADLGTEPPAHGVLVRNAVDESLISHLKWNDVIVALNGFLIYGTATFEVIRELDPAAPLSMTVWRDNKYVRLPDCGGNYVQVNPYLANYRPGVHL
jgi:hypothetical protein